MKATDLRIGNLVNEYGIPTIINSRMLQGIESANELNKIIIDLSYIPLTEEWLLKFGFEKYEWNDSFFIKTKFGHLMIQFYKKEIHLFFTNIGSDSQGIKMDGRKFLGNVKSTQNIHYVHQLQNLYFALTGEELTL